MTTPMMLQYREIKAHVPDAIVFFRLGDFYEMFEEDAETSAPILEIALTARDAGEGKRIPMCGVPYHAAETYLTKLVSAGYKVAICEQVEDPRSAKGIVKREIIRIVTPGTVTDSYQPEKNNTFLTSVYRDTEWGLAFLDISTGDFSVLQTPHWETVVAEIERIHPAEVVLTSNLYQKSKFWTKYFCTQRNFTGFSNRVHERFPAQAHMLSEFPAAARAAEALWVYLQENIPGIDPAHIIEIKNYRQDHWMILDPWSRRNLELTESLRGLGKKGTLLAVLDFTRTAMGGRLLRHWIEQPLLVHSEISRRLDAVEELTTDSLLRSDIFKLLTGVYDLERLMGRVSYGIANAKDLLALAQTLNVLPALCELAASSQAKILKNLSQYLEGLDTLSFNLSEALNPDAPASVKEGNLIKTGYSAEVDELRTLSSGAKEWIARLESVERERTGIRSLKVGYNKVFGYYLEVTHANRDSVPADYIRKQTLANAERFITPDLKEYEQKVLGAQEKLITLEYEIFLQIREEVRAHTQKILTAARTLAEIDTYLSLAEVAVRNNYVRPEIGEEYELKIRDGRHPVVEQMLGTSEFVPNDINLSVQKHLALITGPNMAGKSTYMRQVALIVLMAHIGSFVPARQAAVPLIDRIFTRVGASDDLASGQSTFMVEMQEVAHILRNATAHSLVILDEIGRGTATFDGLSIAWAATEYLVENLPAKVLFATHYHELTQLEENFPGIFNLHVAVKEHGEEIVFLHKILPGRADRSYGIQVARIAGLPESLVKRAKVLLFEFENSQPYLDKEPGKVIQFSLFTEPELHPLLQEIAHVVLEDMTPRQALEYLFDVRERLHSLQTF